MGFSIRILIASCLATLQLSSMNMAADGRKLAVVVGVNTYRQNSGLPPLAHAASDAKNLSAALRTAGFTVFELTHEVAKEDGKEALAPNLEYIRDQISGVLDAPFLGADDAVIISLHGHGVQFEQLGDDGQKTPKFFFCPANATIQGLKSANEITDRNDLLPLDELYDSLGKCSAATKLLIVDACRNDPNQPGVFRNALASATLPKLPPPPGGVAALFSCKPNQMAVEDKDLGQGVFTHFLIEGLQGKADLPLANQSADGVITFSELTTYVATNTYAYVQQKHNGLKQSPEMRGEFDLNLPLAKVALGIIGQRAGEVREFTDLKMKFCWCPPGTFTMGSPASEEDRGDNEDQVDVTLTKGFWLGQTEVTQEQWESVMGSNPSYFSSSGGGKDKVTGQSTSQFPVEWVSWYDAVEFCNRLSEREGLPVYYEMSDVSERKGRSSQRQPPWRALSSVKRQSGLPSAERSGMGVCVSGGDQDAVSLWGGERWDESECRRHYPYGTETKGRNLGRTTRVGSYRSNAWGLSDLHGNVREWCFDGYADQLTGATR
ncbi:MAG: SUMF1/EgtB/PvdO family nonheme iron enzyme [Planctomycetaceae bacterium]